jgi:enoyl-[acyl-carrier protein] reductase II
MTSYPKTGHLMQRGAEFLGSQHAILCGAMSWVSERNLVAAISNAGGFGVIACGAMTPDLLDAEIAGTRALTAKPFGVNLITMHPMLFELIEVCARHGVSHVALAGGIPPKGSVEALKAAGAKVLVFAPTLALAKKLLRGDTGADALVIEGMEAGGHIGPVSTSVLAQEMLPALADEHLVFVAGGIGRGDARDAVASVQLDPRLPVIPVRALKNKGGELFNAKQREVAQNLDKDGIAMEEAQLQIEHYWAGALRRAVIDGDVEHGSLMAGQSVGMVTREEPVAQIIDALLAESEAALTRR